MLKLLEKKTKVLRKGNQKKSYINMKIYKYLLKIPCQSCTHPCSLLLPAITP